MFGSILGVDYDDVVAVAVVTLAVMVVVFFGYRQLLFTTFDPDVAESSGISTARVDALLMVVLSASILVSMQVLGVTLIAATLAIPASIARMLTNSFRDMLFLATGIGAVTGFVGMNQPPPRHPVRSDHRARRGDRVRRGLPGLGSRTRSRLAGIDHH
ncbi:MAG: iron chelate uptake ABC transporter family permease subunit [Acidimicrobiales bacterium]